MDYRTLNEAIAGMNDEQLFLIEKKASEERTRRLALSLAPAPQLGPRQTLHRLGQRLPHQNQAFHVIHDGGRGLRF